MVRAGEIFSFTERNSMLETLGWRVSSTGIFVRTAMRTSPLGCLLVGKGRFFLKIL